MESLEIEINFHHEVVHGMAPIVYRFLPLNTLCRAYSAQLFLLYLPWPSSALRASVSVG